jgi:5-formyltetrahydrofolate cyclo-ligase
MDLTSRKQLLRRECVARILSLGPAERAAQEEALARRHAELPGLADAPCVLLYRTAFPEEVNTEPLLRAALARGQRLVCPKVDLKRRRLTLFAVRDLQADFTPGTLGIPEPAAHCPEVAPGEVDWVLVPGLAFDSRCYRLGRGAGHYDRLLPTIRPSVPRWALALDPQWMDEIPVEPHDVAIDGVISPSRLVTRPD